MEGRQKAYLVLTVSSRKNSASLHEKDSNIELYALIYNRNNVQKVQGK